MVYASISDALRELVLLRDKGGTISKSPKRIKMLSNGQPYYYVEVTCKNESRYVIEAIGREAIKLMEESKKLASAD